MSLQTWLLYALVVLVLVLTVTPGPTVLVCVTNGVNHGARRAFFSAVGIMACSALGVGAVMAASGELFNVIDWFGVGYLLYIGISTLRSSAGCAYKAATRCSTACRVRHSSPPVRSWQR